MPDWKPHYRSMDEILTAYLDMKGRYKMLVSAGQEYSAVAMELKASMATLAWCVGSDAPDGRSIVPPDWYIEARLKSESRRRTGIDKL